MSRTVSVVMAAAATALLLPATAAAQKTLQLGEKYEGEVGNTKKEFPAGTYYGAELPVTLKAGQPLSVSVTVTGANRGVAVTLLDPTGKKIAETSLVTKSALLTVKEVNATGTYKIVVVSDQIGPFTLRAIGPSADEL